MPQAGESSRAIFNSCLKAQVEGLKSNETLDRFCPFPKVDASKQLWVRYESGYTFLFSEDFLLAVESLERSNNEELSQVVIPRPYSTAWNVCIVSDQARIVLPSLHQNERWLTDAFITQRAWPDSLNGVCLEFAEQDCTHTM